MKGNAVYKGTYNKLLELLSEASVGDFLPTSADLAQRLNVSRTTVRAVLTTLQEAGVLSADAKRYRVVRPVASLDPFPDAETLSAKVTVERGFMEWILLGDFEPGQPLNSTELARQFGTSTTAIRESLSSFQHFGLIERRPNSAWIYRGITPALADEIYDVRELFERKSARRFLASADSEARHELRQIHDDHLRIKAEFDDRYQEFPALDERLHRLIHAASENRYIIAFYDVVSVIYHYTYRWNRRDEARRNLAALNEHLDYMAALEQGDGAAVERTLRRHLRNARETMKRSIAIGPRGSTGIADPAAHDVQTPC